jgi:hypothetical protein
MHACSLRSVPVPVLICLFSIVLGNGCSGIFPPDRPENVWATALSQHRVEVTWTCWDEEEYNWWGEPTSSRVSYLVYRDGKQVADVEDPGWVDDGLDPETLYCYRVSSYWDEILDWIFVQESGKSQEACAWTYPLNAISGSVTLGSGGFEGVRIQLIRDLGFPAVLGTEATGPHGGYTFNDLENSQYVVEPSMSGYTFSPDNYQFNLVNQDAYNMDFSISVEQ